MPTIDCAVEDQPKRFQIELDETPRVGEFVIRGTIQYVVASVTWNVGNRRTLINIVLRELPPAP
jgi:hypothetical protein